MAVYFLINQTYRGIWENALASKLNMLILDILKTNQQSAD